MSRLEAAAKPHILLLTEAVASGTGLSITPEVAALLSAWAIKTAWMREYSDPGDVSSTRSMRRHLRDQQLPPAFSQVWIGKHIGELNLDLRQAVIGITDRPGAYKPQDLRRAQFTAMTVRGICMLAYTVDGWGVQPPTRPPTQWLQLWPTDRGQWFPPAKPLSDADVANTVVTHTPWLNLPSSTAFRHHPDGIQQIRRN